MPALHTTTAVRSRPRSVSPVLGAALVEVEELVSRVWSQPSEEQADALAELRVAMAVDAVVPLLDAAQAMERLVTREWAAGTPEQVSCQLRLHHAVHRRR